MELYIRLQSQDSQISIHQCAQQINLRRPCRYGVCCKGDIDVGSPVRLRPRMQAEFLEKPEAYRPDIDQRIVAFPFPPSAP